LLADESGKKALSAENRSPNVGEERVGYVTTAITDRVTSLPNRSVFQNSPELRAPLRPSSGRSSSIQIEYRDNVYLSDAYLPRSDEIETIKVHHLGPGSHKVLHELLLRIAAAVDFSQST